LVIGSKLLEYMARAPKKAEASWRTLAQKLKAAPDLTSLEGKHIDRIVSGNWRRSCKRRWPRLWAGLGTS
jgi:hypothetical protein